MEWIKEFDRDWAYLNGELPKHSGRTEEIKEFITTQITKAYEKGYENGESNVMADFNPATEDMDIELEDTDTVHTIVQKVFKAGVVLKTNI